MIELSKALAVSCRISVNDQGVYHLSKHWFPHHYRETNMAATPEGGAAQVKKNIDQSRKIQI